MSAEFKKFREEILSEMKNKPSYYRDGQFVFNYIDENYGVARTVQFKDKIDCFYNDKNIEDFIAISFEELVKMKEKQKMMDNPN